MPSKGLLLTFGLTYGGGLVALFNPFVGLLIYVCFSIIRPEFIWSYAVPRGNYSRIVGVALLVGWLVHGFGSWKLGRAKPVVAFLVAFFLWNVISAIAATVENDAGRFAVGTRVGRLLITGVDPSWRVVEEFLKIFLPFMVGVTELTTLRRLRQLAWVILASQGYVAYELNASYYGGFNQLQEVGFAGLDNNTYAITAVASIGLAFFLGVHSASLWGKLIAFALGGVLVNSIMFSFSRGGVLSLS